MLNTHSKRASILFSSALVALFAVTGQCAHAQTLCGDANDDSNRTATDASIALRAAVGSTTCDLCICDVDRSGGVAATDGLRILQFGVGQPVILDCISCGVPTTTTVAPTTTTTVSTTTTTTMPTCPGVDISGTWFLTVTEVSENCGDGLGSPTNLSITLSESANGTITVVSPQLPFNQLMIRRTGCTVSISYNQFESGGTTFYTGMLNVSPSGNSFGGDVDWEFCDGFGCVCSGVDNWSLSRIGAG